MGKLKQRLSEAARRLAAALSPRLWSSKLKEKLSGSPLQAAQAPLQESSASAASKTTFVASLDPEPGPPSSSSFSRRFQFMSDLHLEFPYYQTFDFPVTAPYLILAGDIGNLNDRASFLVFLQRQAARYERVFLVLGNHEFYGMSYDEGIRAARQMTSHRALCGKVTLLHQSRFDIPYPDTPKNTWKLAALFRRGKKGTEGKGDNGRKGAASVAKGQADTASVEGTPGSGDNAGSSSKEPLPRITILGCTLWSHIKPALAAGIALRVNDFTAIKGWTVADQNLTHAAEVAWLRSELVHIREEDPSRVVIVATHHAPVVDGSSPPRHKGDPCSPAFSTDLCHRPRPRDHDRDGSKPAAEPHPQQDWLLPVRYWIFRHTHWTTRLRGAHGITVVANQRGYTNEKTSKVWGKLTKEHLFDSAMTLQL